MVFCGLFPADAADFEEASGEGYAGLPLTQYSMSKVAPWVVKADLRWQFTGALGMVYGWYLTSDLNEELLAWDKLERSPEEIRARGDVIAVAVSLSFGK